MALTKWLDPNLTDTWTIADWTDTDLIVLISHIWPSLKGAADERVAFSKRSQLSGFPASFIFPALDDAIIQSTDVTNIPNAVWPESVVRESEIETSGTYSNPSSHPAYLSLSDFLQDVESYGSGTLEIITDTSSGSVVALLRWLWAIQLYQSLNYPKYYMRPLTTSGSLPYSLIEKRSLSVQTTYSYNYTTSSLIAVDCRKSLNNAASTSIYTANDLNETAPFSTPQEVKDYTVSQFDTEFAALTGTDWATKTSIANGSIYGSTYRDQIFNFGGPTRYEFTSSASIIQYRFKVNQEYRADNTRYDSEQWANYYYRDNSDTYQDFDTGKTDGSIEFTKLIADGSDYFVLEISGVDYSNTGTGSPPTLPPSPSGTPNTAGGSIYKGHINPVGQSTFSVYAKPNLTDGTGFEYYTP